MGLVTGAAAAGFALIAGVLAFVHFRETPLVPATVRFEISAPDKTVLAAFPPAVSPDGRSVAFVARGEDGQDRIWIRSIDSLEPRMLRGTEGVRNPGAFWSPDSRFLGFFAAGSNRSTRALSSRRATPFRLRSSSKARLAGRLRIFRLRRAASWHIEPVPFQAASA